MDRARRRQLVHTLIGINGVGFVAVGILLVDVFKAGYTPWFGLSAEAVLFLGIVVPFYREFLALREGFEEVEREAMHTIRRRRGELIGQEVLPHERPKPFSRVRAQPLTALALTLLGWGLAVAEGVRWWVAN